MTHAPSVYPLALEAEVIEALRTVYDPEIPVNIYELGLVYEVDVDDLGEVDVTMTLTSPACPVAGSLPGEVEARVRQVPGVSEARVHLTWEPAWSMDLMSEEAKLESGLLVGGSDLHRVETPCFPVQIPAFAGGRGCPRRLC